MEEERKQQEKERNYVSPDFEVVEIEFEQNILESGSGSGTGEQLDDMEELNW
jgi:hypothetical protein